MSQATRQAPEDRSCVHHTRHSNQLLSLSRLVGCRVQDEDGYPVITRNTDPAEIADRVDAFPVSSKGYISKVSWGLACLYKWLATMV